MAKKKKKPTTANSIDVNFGNVVTMRAAQEGLNFCWAACAQMVAVSVNIGLDPQRIPSQTELATAVFGQPEDSPASTEQMGRIVYAGGALGKKIKCSVIPDNPENPSIPRNLTQDDLDDQLRQGTPVVIAFRFWGTRGHVVLVAGFDRDEDGNRLYIVFDPAPTDMGTERTLSYQDLLNGSFLAGDAMWNETVFDFARG